MDPQFGREGFLAARAPDQLQAFAQRHRARPRAGMRIVFTPDSVCCIYANHAIYFGVGTLPSRAVNTTIASLAHVVRNVAPETHAERTVQDHSLRTGPHRPWHGRVLFGRRRHAEFAGLCCLQSAGVVRLEREQQGNVATLTGRHSARWQGGTL